MQKERSVECVHPLSAWTLQVCEYINTKRHSACKRINENRIANVFCTNETSVSTQALEPFCCDSVYTFVFVASLLLAFSHIVSVERSGCAICRFGTKCSWLNGLEREMRVLLSAQWINRSLQAHTHFFCSVSFERQYLYVIAVEMELSANIWNLEIDFSYGILMF